MFESRVSIDTVRVAASQVYRSRSLRVDLEMVAVDVWPDVAPARPEVGQGVQNLVRSQRRVQIEMNCHDRSDPQLQPLSAQPERRILIGHEHEGVAVHSVAPSQHTDDEVEQKFNEIKSPDSGDDFKKKLQERGISEADFKRDLRRTLTAQKVMNKEITSKITVTDADTGQVRNVYPTWMQDVVDGPRDFHYGNNFDMPAGHHYQLQVVIAHGETASAKVYLQ